MCYSEYKRREGRGFPRAGRAAPRDFLRAKPKGNPEPARTVHIHKVQLECPQLHITAGLSIFTQSSWTVHIHTVQLVCQHSKLLSVLGITTRRGNLVVKRPFTTRQTNSHIVKSPLDTQLNFG